jgi:hypothetical protein
MTVNEVEMSSMFKAEFMCGQVQTYRCKQAHQEKLSNPLGESENGLIF